MIYGNIIIITLVESSCQTHNWASSQWELFITTAIYIGIHIQSIELLKRFPHRAYNPQLNFCRKHAAMLQSLHDDYSFTYYSGCFL